MEKIDQHPDIFDLRLVISAYKKDLEKIQAKQKILKSAIKALEKIEGEDKQNGEMEIRISLPA